ncbi:MAG TPA: helix-turn-helix domain-containing protein [Phycisphaerae bacterium]|nr:helix-turn-helix domain-containing protein [Phycisphaerae bacterium]
MSFRKTIQTELRGRKWSAYRLAKEAGLSIRTVQAYLAGDLDTTGERIEAMCEALGLQLRRKRKPKDG